MILIVDSNFVNMLKNTYGMHEDQILQYSQISIASSKVFYRRQRVVAMVVTMKVKTS